jgi:AAA15 family ATPase/GTPase
MILSFSIQNFFSFKERVTFSFEATNDKHLEEYHVVQVNEKTRINKLGILYGANASGKSNLIRALQFLHEFFETKMPSKDRPLNFHPFLLDDSSRGENSFFELIFFIGPHKHVYQLELNKQHVVSEQLQKYKSIRPTVLFHRTLSDHVTEIRFNDGLGISKAVKEEVQVKCLNNMSVFAACGQVNARLSEIEEVMGWISNRFMPVVTPDTKLTAFVENLISSDKTAHAYVLGLLNYADFNIADIQIKRTEHKLSEKQVAELLAYDELSEEIKSQVETKKTIQILETNYSHKVVNQEGQVQNVALPKTLQSAGTVRTMGLAGVFHRVLASKGFVAVDELESSLHPKLIHHLIETFLKESDQAQLLFTTHYDGLLADDELLRNDTIWFAEKQPDGSSTLYSLSDFNGVNRISSLQKAYRYGKFGAVPNL